MTTVGVAGALRGAAALGWTEREAAAFGVGNLGDLYRSADLLEAERRDVLRSWSLVATTQELGPRRYVTAEPGGVPVILVRDDDGTLRAFHNVCRHRGMPLADGYGEAGRYLTCPYHQWSFALDGSLTRVPQRDEQFPGIDRAALGLRPAAVAEWNGMVFVNPSKDPEPLPAALGPLPAKLANWFAGPLEQVAVVSYDVACNWKFIVENHIDVYHLWYLHQRSLAAYDHRSFAWAWEDDTWWSFEPLKPSETVPAGIDWLRDDERAGIGAHLLFPNLMLVTTADYFATYDAVPVAPDRTRLTLRVRSTPDVDAEALVVSIRAFLAEDVAGCERLQVATASPYFELGPLALDHEAPIRRFHDGLRRRLVGVPG
jgi:choline monooxygenase